MYNVFEAPFVKDVCAMASNIYRLGWGERNGGNFSCRLEKGLVGHYLDLSNVKRRFELNFEASPLAGEVFIVTRAGSFFRNIEACPQNDLCILRISDDGKHVDVLWGLEGGGKPTSELATHLMNHIVRMKSEPEQRVVIHCHPSNTLAMTFVHKLDDRKLTKTLWQMSTECMQVFPDGVRILPWMLCGTSDIGCATAEKIKDCRIVLWSQHGIFAAGRSIDEAFGLIETVEKAAEIYMKIGDRPILQTITNVQLAELAKAFGVTPKEGYLEL